MLPNLRKLPSLNLSYAYSEYENHASCRKTFPPPLTLDCTPDCMILVWARITKLRAQQCKSVRSRNALP